MDRAILKPTHCRYGFAMSQGRRARQEDFACADGEVFGVFDGMGGHFDGDEASRLAGEGFMHGEGLIGRLKAAQTNLILYRRAYEYQKPMCTVVAAAIEAETISLAWLGDSRGYILDGDKYLVQTTDHAGRYGEVLLSLGGNFDDKPSVICIPRKPCRILLCTDGLYGLFQPSVLRAKLQEHTDPGACAIALMEHRAGVEAENQHLKTDNATIFVIDVE